MTRIVLHAGMDKTGTTSVQTVMARNAARMRAGGVLYPVAGRYGGDVNHLALARSLTPDPPAIPTPLPPPPLDWEGSVEALHREIDAARPRVTFLSSEAFWIPDAFPIRALSRLAADLAPNRVEVLIFLRPAGSYLRSSYAQSVRGPQRSRLGFETHVRNMVARRMVDYAARIAEFRRVFGRDRVHVRRYTPRGPGTLRTVLDLLGAPDPANDPVAAHHANGQVSRAGLHLYRLANRARLPRRAIPWTLEPVDRAWKSAMAASEIARTLDARIDPSDPDDLRRLDADHPLPDEVLGVPPEGERG
ncbi:hypothetical protein E2L08_07210 [Palleronia sediminis]|uniref:Uncharacterized protein n=1 Tax=Palleronia sediminis TaxID=2547833 RepID=A0A4R6AFB8_9RHOB|nr:hypothetical protein [Palleronia sediminis]TDL81118.1 hypothetical protein E2L08_07210 [Palleronia sediminis]